MDIRNLDLESVDVDWRLNHCARVRTTYVSCVKQFTGDSITFEGYFLYEPETMPIERVLSLSYKTLDSGKWIREDYHVKITEMTKKDAPFRCEICEKGEVCNPEENHIRFFPDQTVNIHFEIISNITSKDQLHAVIQKIKGDEPAVIERENHYRELRRKKELQEYMKRLGAFTEKTP